MAEADVPPAGLAPADETAIFFREIVDLAAGPHSVRLNVQFSAAAKADHIRVYARLNGDEGSVELASAEVRSDEDEALSKADSLVLTFVLDAPAAVTFEGRVSANPASTHLRHFSQAPIAGLTADDSAFWFHSDGVIPRRPLRFVVIGTTATCNANCTHCPTNKAYTRAQARGVMDMELFERIVRNLGEMNFDGGFCFGLHGEPLQDPFLTRRVEIIRELCPLARVGISTNAATYNPAAHLEVLRGMDDVTVHIEALDPQVYNDVMRPLKASRTFPKVEGLIAELGDKVRITSPVHKQNVDHVVPLKLHWEAKGAGESTLVPLSNRCGQSPTFEAIALAPMGVGCDPDMVSELAIDWDGAVLTCCQDFHRRSIIGDLRRETVAEVMENQERNRVRDLFNRKRWGELETCVNCRWDDGDKMGCMVEARLSPHDQKRRFEPDLFEWRGPVQADEGALVVRARNLMGRLGLRKRAPKATLFGPKRRLTEGRYRIVYDIDEARIDFRGSITLDIARGQEIVARHSPAAEGGRWEMELDVARDTELLQFRLHAAAASLRFSGVTAERLS